MIAHSVSWDDLLRITLNISFYQIESESHLLSSIGFYFAQREQFCQLRLRGDNKIEHPVTLHTVRMLAHTRTISTGE